MAMSVTACWPTSDGDRTVGVVLMWDEDLNSYTRPQNLPVNEDVDMLSKVYATELGFTHCDISVNLALPSSWSSMDGSLTLD
jgi:hypothetical protein